MACCVRGYHVYKDVWAATVGEVLACRREPSNASDRYAIAVLKRGSIIGHLPRKISKVCLFLRGGCICCTVTGEYGHQMWPPNSAICRSSRLEDAIAADVMRSFWIG